MLGAWMRAGATCILVACSSGDGTASKEPNLTGEWQTACLDRALLGKSGTGSFMATLQVEVDDRFTETRRFFADTGCAEAMHEERRAGSLILGSKLTEGTPPLRAVNWTFASVTITPEGAQGAEALNASAHCGLSGWTAGAAKDVAGKSCAGITMPASGSVFYDVAEIAGNNVAFGRPEGDLDGSADDKRPAGVSDVIYSRE